MIDVAPNGVKPMFRQAIDEILVLRDAVRGADRLNADTLYRGNEGAKDVYMKYRALVKLPTDVDPRGIRDLDGMNCPNLFQGHAGDPCRKCGWGPCTVVGRGIGL